MERLFRAAIKMAMDAQYTDAEIAAILTNLAEEVSRRRFQLERNTIRGWK